MKLRGEKFDLDTVDAVSLLDYHPFNSLVEDTTDEHSQHAMKMCLVEKSNIKKNEISELEFDLNPNYQDDFFITQKEQYYGLYWTEQAAINSRDDSVVDSSYPQCYRNDLLSVPSSVYQQAVEKCLKLEQQNKELIRLQQHYNSQDLLLLSYPDQYYTSNEELNPMHTEEKDMQGINEKSNHKSNSSPVKRRGGIDRFKYRPRRPTPNKPYTSQMKFAVSAPLRFSWNPHDWK